MEEMELACVIVSPLRRTMQTAYYLLKDRPDFANILFIVEPLCREHLHTSGDVPSTQVEATALAK